MASRLGPSWVLQPKIDGCYAQLHLDGSGRVARVLSRTGREYGQSVVGDLLGAFVGWPHAVLVGELEAHTETGERLAAARGARGCWLFDCLRGARGEYLGHRPYRERRAQLWRMQSEVVNLAPDRGWDRDATGRAHASDGRFCAATPADWRLTPIVPQLPAARADAAWAEWVDRDAGEGLVAVALDAPVGRRNAKRKVKVADTIDAVCIAADERTMVMHWTAAGLTFTVGRKRGRVGAVYEVACDGYYDSGEPRFARVLRQRIDLQEQA